MGVKEKGPIGPYESIDGRWSDIDAPTEIFLVRYFGTGVVGF